MAKKHGTSGGVEITDEVIERLAARAERGLAHTRLRRRGRPPLGDAPARVAQVRLPPALSEALAERAARDGTAPSTIIREALREYLSR